MLRRAEAALVEREPEIPGLGLLLDDEAFGELLAELLPDRGVRSARAVYLRYKPRTSCLVSYRVLGREGELDVHAQARSSVTRQKLEKARARAGRHDPARLFVLEDRATVVAVFPEDGELRVLARLAEPSTRGELLGRLLGRDPRVDGSLVRVRYKPERRWVGRLALGDGSAVALKAYAPAGFESALRGSRAFIDEPPLRAPRLRGALPERRLIAVEWIAGRALAEALREGQAGAREVALAGEALACVHGQRPAGLPAETPARRAHRVLAAAAAVCSVQPELSARVARLAREVTDGLVAQVGAVAPTHGDFHAGQVLVAHGVAAVIDFDEAVQGAPASDLASFIAHLEWQAGAASGSLIEGLERALLDGYSRRAALPPNEELALSTGAALFRIAPHFFRNRHPEWPERTEATLDRIEALLERARRSSGAAGGQGAPRLSARVTDPFGALADEGIPFLPLALDPTVAQERFRRLPDLQARVPGFRLRSARVLRHKPGRRCLIEYELATAEAAAEPVFVLGKVRARGADRRTHALARRLVECGFGPESADGTSVPEPLGVVPELGMWLQARVGGEAATARLRGSDGIRVAERVADALYKLHRAPVAPGRRHTIGDEIAILRERLQEIAGARPEWAARLDRVAESCARAVSALAAPAPVLIHRDFYPDQVLVDGERVHIVDLDL